MLATEARCKICTMHVSHPANAAINVTWHKGQQLLHDAHITQLDCLCSIKPRVKPAQSTALSQNEYTSCDIHSKARVSACATI
jgi:hypothetical protein